MCQRSFFSRSCSRIAEEVQLRAEEEFMVEALKRIRQQRNCLQIERLHLENLKLQLENSVNNSESKDQTTEQENTNKSANLVPYKPTELRSVVDLMNLGSMQHKNDIADLDEDMQCNTQELDLNPTTSSASTSKSKFGQYNYDSDEGTSSEASDGEDMLIDINMLMNGTNGRD